MHFPEFIRSAAGHDAAGCDGRVQRTAEAAERDPQNSGISQPQT